MDTKQAYFPWVCLLPAFATLLSVFAILAMPLSANAAPSFGVTDLPKRRLAPSAEALRTLKTAQVEWARQTIRWNDLCGDDISKPSYLIWDWQKLDAIVQRGIAFDVRMLCTLKSAHMVFAPGSIRVKLANKMLWKSAPPSSDHIEDYKMFIRSVIERYDGDGFEDAPFINAIHNVKHWQIENEPGDEAHRGSNYWAGDAWQYANHFVVAHDAIKAADPEARILLAGFAGSQLEYCDSINFNSSPGSTIQCFASVAISEIRKAGADFDMFDYHYYAPYTQADRYKIMASRIARRDTNEDDPNDSNDGFSWIEKPIWVTEIGLWAPEAKSRFTSFESYKAFAARDLVRRYCGLLYNNVEMVAWWGFSDAWAPQHWGSANKSQQIVQYRGLCSSDFSPTAPYWALNQFISKVNERNSVIKHSLQENVWMYSFERTHDNSYSTARFVVWYDNGRGDEITKLQMPFWSGKNVKIEQVRMLPQNVEPISATVDSEGMLRLGLISKLKGLRDEPIYIYLADDYDGTF